MDTNSHHQNSIKSNNLKDKLEKEFQKIYEDYYKLLFYISFGIVNNTADAEDAVNETFLGLFNNYFNVKNIKYYLITSVKNTSYNIYKKRKNDIHLSLEDNNIEIEDINQRNKIDEFFNEIKSFITNEELDIIVCHLIYNLSFSDIARDKNKSRFSVAGKYRRSIAKIKKYYERSNVNEKKHI